VYQGTQKRASQGASEYRQVSLPQSKLIPSIIQPTGRLQPLGSALNGHYVVSSETKRPADPDQPGYSGLFRDKKQNIFSSGPSEKNRVRAALGGNHVPVADGFVGPPRWRFVRSLRIITHWPPPLGNFRHPFGYRPSQLFQLYSRVLTYSHVYSHKKISFFIFTALVKRMKSSPAYAPCRICPPPGLRRHPRSIAQPSFGGSARMRPQLNAQPNAA
jgi:hypothetical protein